MLIGFIAYGLPGVVFGLLLYWAFPFVLLAFVCMIELIRRIFNP